MEEDKHRGMKQRKDGERCGQVERNPSEQEARNVLLTLSQKPEEGRQDANTCVKNESYESFQDPDLTVYECVRMRQ